MAETIENTILKGLSKLDFFDSKDENPGKTLKLVIRDTVGQEVGNLTFKTTTPLPVYVPIIKICKIPPEGHELWLESKGWGKVKFLDNWTVEVSEAGYKLRICEIPKRYRA